MKRNVFSKQGIASACMMLIVLAAFAVQAILPAGFMPSVNKDGFTEIVICSGMDMKTVLVPADDALPSSQPVEKENPVCAYQTLAVQKILIAPPALNPPVAATLEIPAVFFTVQLPVTSPVFSFTARGPPSA